MRRLNVDDILRLDPSSLDSDRRFPMIPFTVTNGVSTGRASSNLDVASSMRIVRNDLDVCVVEFTRPDKVTQRYVLRRSTPTGDVDGSPSS